MTDKPKRRGRPPIRKKGAFTSAERQRRRRKRLAHERWEAEQAATRERNQRLFREGAAQREAEWAAMRPAFEAELDARAAQAAPRLPDPWGPADELARQIEEYMMGDAGAFTIDDLPAALDRRFGWNIN
jgi:hypothetical protein